MILHFTLKFFELFKCFRLVFHQVDIPISAQIICGQKITIPAASLNTHRTAYITMYYFNKSVARSIVSENGVSVILPWFASIKWFIIKWFQKIHPYGVSSCALHQYDLNGSATNKLHYHYQLCIFLLQHYEYVYHYYRDSTKTDHSLKVHDHKITHINRTIIILWL